VVFNLLNQTTSPSFLDMMKTNGITAERWDPVAYIGSGMNTFNHHMFGGGPGEWMVKGVAGISPAQPGYAQILIQPEVVGDLTSGNGSISTPKGQVSTSWTKVSSTQFNLKVTIPANSTAIVSIPTLGGTSSQITEGGVTIYKGGFVSGRSGINSIQSTANGRIAFNVGSGSYSFVMTSM
jgi:alpha-L-rhamnosidase